ncbi:DUF7289 family protein [Halovivax limisalsi]|uniref:DUF7289 family protein n=1 Tax=Halovivax limisalsi TaxID=1453760 RepID=UPI001FFC796F|nr:hypothetical protein [Halovivax limisalsi]
MGDRGFERGTSTDRSDEHRRSVSPVVGVIFLFGMVAAGAVVLGVSGMALMDTLETDSEGEQLRSCLQETNQRASTALSYSTAEEVPCEGGTYVPDGQLYLVWHNDTGGSTDLPADYADTTVHVDPLGAIEFGNDARTYAYQGGGTWTVADGYARPMASPPFEYADELRADVIAIDDGPGSSGPQRLDRNRDGTIGAKIQRAQREAYERGYSNLTIVVESSYHRGWKQHFQRAMTNGSADVSTDLDEFPRVDDNRAVRVDVSDLYEREPASFVVAADHGLSGSLVSNHVITPPGGAPGRNTVEFTAEIENVGGTIGGTSVEFDVLGAGIDRETTVDDLAPGDSKNVTFDVPYGEINGLSTGESYDYTITVEDGTGLKSEGSFFVAESAGPRLEVTNASATKRSAVASPGPDEQIVIEADVTNTGGSNATDGEIALSLELPEYDFDDPYNLTEMDPFTVDRTVGASAPVRWTINSTSLLGAEHDFTVSAVDNTDPDGEDGGTFANENGPDVGDTELILPGGSNVNVSVLGTEIGTEADANNNVRWGAAFGSIYTQPVESGDFVGDSIDPTGPAERVEGVPWHDQNLNRWDDHRTIFSHSFTTEERVSLLFQARSYYTCSYGGPNSYGGHKYSDSTTIGSTLYHHYDCPTGLEYDPLVEIEADAGAEKTNVRVLSQEDNVLPQLDPGIEIQQSAKDLLERPEVDINVTELPDGSAELDLDDNEYIFVFELTHYPGMTGTGCYVDPSVSPDEYWQKAFDCPNDPDFNDMLVHVDVESMDPEPYDFRGTFDGGNGLDAPFGPGDPADSDETIDPGPSVEVGSGELIIG